MTIRHCVLLYVYRAKLTKQYQLLNCSLFVKLSKTHYLLL